jgi:hypothetical protein
MGKRVSHRDHGGHREESEKDISIYPRRNEAFFSGFLSVTSVISVAIKRLIFHRVDPV